MLWRLATALLLLSISAAAHEGDEPDADYFNSLTLPDSSSSCCGQHHDCVATDYRLGVGGYEVPLGNAWVPVPGWAVLHRANPTGRGTVCVYQGRILCLNPAEEG